MLGLIKLAYRNVVPLPIRNHIWRLRHAAGQHSPDVQPVGQHSPDVQPVGQHSPEVQPVDLSKPNAEPPVSASVPDLTGLLRKGFAITAESQARMEAEIPWVALYINSNCSHACVYCVSGMQDGIERKGLLEEIGPEAYVKHLLDLVGDLKVRFNFAGPGECAEHKDFIYIVRAVLDAGHSVVIQTHGLSSKRIAKALEGYPKEVLRDRVRIHLSFHLAAYLDDKDTRRIDAYINNHVPRIMEFGSDVYLIVPLSPKVLISENTHAYLRGIQQAADNVSTKLIYQMVEFHGLYEGRSFPGDYTEEEQRAFSRMMKQYGNPSRGETDGESASTTGRSLFLKGFPCYAHVLTTEVLPDGAIRHCQSIPEPRDTFLGDGTRLSNLVRPLPCPFNECSCISVGYNMSLKPLGLTLRDYADELAIVKNQSGS